MIGGERKVIIRTKNEKRIKLFGQLEKKLYLCTQKSRDRAVGSSSGS